MSRLLSTLQGTSWAGTTVSGEGMVTDSSYHAHIAFQAASQLAKVERFGTIKRKLVTTRAFVPYMVNLIVRRSMQDMVGENVPVVLYAKSGQAAHAATQAAKIWERVARAGKPITDPWPDSDSEASMEQLDDNDFYRIMKDARDPRRVDRCFFGGHPLDPWVVMIGDTEMAHDLLIDLRQKGPTFGGSIAEDLAPELGGRGYEMEASMDPNLLEDTHDAG